MTTTRPAKVLSYGGGLDSFAMLVDAIQRGDLPDAVVMADVGDAASGDLGEWPSTYRHIDEVVRPLCARHGIRFELLDGKRYPVRGARSLWRWYWGDRAPGAKRGNLQLPMSKAGLRLCSAIAKHERVDAWLEDNFPGQVVELWIGFEANEIARVTKGDAAQGKSQLRRNRYPLVERDLCRCRCEQLVRAAGYPVPRKSACVFCPYATKADYRTLATELPAQFDAIVQLEAAKPPTSNGLKLSIKGYDTRKKNQLGAAYVPPTLAEWTWAPDRSRGQGACPVCGAAEIATKATGCSYLSEPERLAA